MLNSPDASLDSTAASRDCNSNRCSQRDIGRLRSPTENSSSERSPASINNLSASIALFQRSRSFSEVCLSMAPIDEGYYLERWRKPLCRSASRHGGAGLRQAD